MTKRFLWENFAMDIGVRIKKKWLRNGKKIPLGIESGFLGLCNSLLLGLGQDWEKHPAAHTGGVSRGRVRGCGCWCKWHVTGDRWYLTPDTWHLTPDSRHLTPDCLSVLIFFVLLSAHIKRFSVSRMQDFKTSQPNYRKTLPLWNFVHFTY